MPDSSSAQTNPKRKRGLQTELPRSRVGLVFRHTPCLRRTNAPCGREPSQTLLPCEFIASVRCINLGLCKRWPGGQDSGGRRPGRRFPRRVRLRLCFVMKPLNFQLHNFQLSSSLRIVPPRWLHRFSACGGDNRRRCNLLHRRRLRSERRCRINLIRKSQKRRIDLTTLCRDIAALRSLPTSNFQLQISPCLKPRPRTFSPPNYPSLGVWRFRAERKGVRKKRCQGKEKGKKRCQQPFLEDKNGS